MDLEDAMIELIPLNSPARQPYLEPEKAAHLDRVLVSHGALVDRKYRAGQLEHGGECWKKPGMLAHALDEVADLTVYLPTAREQMVDMAAKLRAGEATALDAADFLDRLWTK